MIPNETKRQTPIGSYRNVPLTFTENVGQTRGDICYLSHKPGVTIGFSSAEIQFVLTKNTPDRREGMALFLQFLGANADVQIEGRRQDTGKFNYFIGNDPAKWHTGVPTYREIVYRELWSGVDLVLYGDNGKFKYDVVVQPGARLDDIRFVYRGADELSLSEEGNLQIHTSHGVLTEERPVSYQVIDDSRVPVESRFVLPEGQGDCVFGFEIGDGYHPGHPLVIDPFVLFYSTYLGGSDTDIGFSIAVDNQDNAYVTGQTLSLDFPITPGAFQPGKDGSSSAFVTKMNSSGTFLEYSTFIGGNSFDLGRGIAVDDSGHAYVTGQTLSPDFPTTPGAFQTFIGGAQDAFVTKLSPDGGFLIYSTFLGGEGVDTGFGITVDNVGSAYVTGGTSSVNFPLINAFQGFIANEHVFVTKLNPGGSALEYSTLLGGHGIETGRGIAVDGAGQAYVTGLTTSVDFPTTPGAFQINLTGVIGAFVSKVDPSGLALVYSTFLTGNGDDEGHGIAADEFGQAYVTGSTTSFDFPVTPGSFQPFYGGGSSDAFVTKLSPSGDYQVYSTFLGGGESDAGNGIAVRTGFAYVTGSTTSFNFPTTPDALQPSLHGGSDGFITQLNIMGNELVFSTYLGGSSSDTGNAIAVDNTGCVFVTGQTFSFDFPVTGVFQPFLRGDSDAFVIRLCLSLGTTINKFPDRYEVRRGEPVRYFIEIHNPSATTLTNVVVEDPTLGIFQVIPEIPPFSVHILEFDFIVPFDAPFGPLRNIVSITSDQFGEPLTGEAEILITPSPALIATKTVNPPAAAPGETVIFTITLVNQGDVELFNVHIVDPLIGLDQFINVLYVGEVFVIDWPFIIPKDAQAGLTISNIVTITADNLPNPEEVGTVVEVLPVPRLDITKTADRNVVFPGETVNYTIQVFNTGNTDLFNVHVTDDLTGFDIIIPFLPFGQSETFVIPFFFPLEMPPQTYTNTAVATSDQTEPVSDSTDVTVLSDPRLGISKVPATTTAVVGQTIQYTITLENIGNVPLTGIRVFDPLLGFERFVDILFPGEVLTFVFDFTIPQDTPIGSDIFNIVSVTSNEGVTEEAESSVTVTGFGLSLTKVPDLPAVAPGETVTYTLTVTNLLDVAQTNVVLTDALLGLSEVIDFLPANATVTRTVVFTIPVDAQISSVIQNTFTVASDQTPEQETIAEVVVIPPPGPALRIQKLPDRNTASPGETITYTLTVTNLLNIPLTNVVLTDALLGLSETIPVLQANETITRTVTFIVPADAQIGSIIRNTFTVSSDQSPDLESSAEVLVQTPPGPSLLIQKVPDRNTAAPGETITYTLTVTNLLDTPQTNVVLTDELLGFSETIAELPANGTITRTVTFTVPTDTPNGSVIRNTFIAVSDQSPQVETIAEVNVEIGPAVETTLAVRKLPDRTTAEPGETIRYTVEVTNTGTIPATNVVVRDSLTGQQLTIPVIAPSATERVQFSFTVPAGTPQGQVIANRVTVTWTEQSPDTPPAEDEVRVDIAIPAELPDLDVEATPDLPSPGETVIKTITVTNTTDITLTNVNVFDQLIGFQTIIPSLAPGESRVFSLQLPIPPGTVGGTEFRNIVTMRPDQTPPQQQEVTVEVQSLPDASLTKTVDHPVGKPGDKVIFTIRACNTGNVPLLNVLLTDPLLGIQVRIVRFEVGACETLQVPFVLPDVEEDTLIVNSVKLTSDNGPTREASASVTVITEEEE
ncbi:SBBP repeat-containing protein [Paenibacillus sp. 843]|uniref:DUF7507 domain-containing protein n=1 Tax=Paenibacillus sp. 843 TaxID=3341795 RepID=UPI00372CA517